MKKIFLTFFVFLVFSIPVSAKEIDIISREEWWANEEYTYSASTYWADIFIAREAARVAALNSVATPAQSAAQRAAAALSRERINYVNANFASRYATTWKDYYSDGNRLVWPVTKLKDVDTIVLHHTYTEYDSSLEWVRNILKFHSLINGWWDIGYNFVIWYDGEIYEWRKWWDYTMWSHTHWNNFKTVWISMMWDYNVREMNDKQKESLNELLDHLIYKYDISMTKQIPMHTLCSDCTNGITTEYFSPIAWHRDWGHTSCPWQNIYDLIPGLNEKFKNEQVALNTLFLKLPTIFSSYETEKLTVLDQKIKLLGTQKTSEKNKHIISELWEIIGTELATR